MDVQKKEKFLKEQKENLGINQEIKNINNFLQEIVEAQIKFKEEMKEKEKKSEKQLKEELGIYQSNKSE